MLPYALSGSKNILHIQPTSSFAERVPYDGLQPFGVTETAIWTNELKRNETGKLEKKCQEDQHVVLTSVLNILVFEVLLRLTRWSFYHRF